MKLLNKTLLYFLLISLPLLVLACVFSYFVVRGELMENTEEILEKEKATAEQLIMKGISRDVVYLDSDSLSTIRFTPGTVVHTNYRDTVLYNSYEGEMENYRLLQSSHSKEGKAYTITILKPTVEEEDLLESLSTSFVIILIVLILVFSAVTWILSRTLWKPFYRMLNQLKAFDLRKNAHISYQRSSVKEFQQLNETLEKMSLKIYSDYLHQKEFTENSAHEMQTPLAIIKTHIGLLMQSSHLKAEEMTQLQAIENTVKKLTSLNKALLLLAKIENNQFSGSEALNLGELIRKVVDELDAFVSLKELTLQIIPQGHTIAQMNPVLAEVLLSNLIHNAIRYSPKKGNIFIELHGRDLLIRNSGEPLSIKPEELFLRFKKNDASGDSIGLGLAIVKSIADLYNLNIGYSYAEGYHRFTIRF
jgi:signal transduction histidine kinase